MATPGLLDALLQGVITGSIIAAGALGLSLIYSIAEVPNFAHGDMITVGAYLVLLFNAPEAVPFLPDFGSVPLVVAAVLGIAVAGGFGAVYELAIFRRFRERDADLITMVIVSLGLSLILRNVVLFLVGSKNVRYETARVVNTNVDLYLTGDHNAVELQGYDQTVAFYHEGKHNTVRIAPKMSLETRRDDGTHTSIQRDEELETEPPGTDLIRKTREEALSDLGLFGYGKVTYQTEADDQDRCRYCGRDTGDVVHRHQEEVLAILGLTFTMEKGDVSDECEFCTTKVDVGLDEDDRRRIFD